MAKMLTWYVLMCVGFESSIQSSPRIGYVSAPKGFMMVPLFSLVGLSDFGHVTMNRVSAIMSVTSLISIHHCLKLDAPAAL